MKNTMTVAVLIIMLSSAAMAGDNPPPLLFEQSVVCPAPKPVCEPAPACAPPPVLTNNQFIDCNKTSVMTINASAVPASCGYPDRLAPAVHDTAKPCQPSVSKACSTVTEIEIIPFRRKIMMDEVYTVNEKHTMTIDEVKTRTATRKVPVPSAKIVDDITLRPTQPSCGSAPRLARAIETKAMPITVYVKEEFEETYTVPIKIDYYTPINKTRKVAQYIDDYKIATKTRRK